MKTRVSALMDGELEQQDAQSTLQSLKSTEALRREWQDFHVIGDALRGESQLPMDITARVMEALQDEPTVLAPVRRAPKRWLQSALALAASAAGVAVVAWVGLGSEPSVLPNNGSGAMLTASRSLSSPVPQVAAQPVAETNAPRMQEYLLAHQTHGSAGALLSGSHYVRTVSMAREGR